MDPSFSNLLRATGLQPRNGDLDLKPLPSFLEEHEIERILDSLEKQPQLEARLLQEVLKDAGRIVDENKQTPQYRHPQRIATAPTRHAGGSHMRPPVTQNRHAHAQPAQTLQKPTYRPGRPSSRTPMAPARPAMVPVLTSRMMRPQATSRAPSTTATVWMNQGRSVNQAHIASQRMPVRSSFVSQSASMPGWETRPRPTASFQESTLQAQRQIQHISQLSSCSHHKRYTPY